MKKLVLYRITSLTLAILMLFTSIGFSADIHFCKGEFKSFSLIGEARSCHTAKKSCPHHANMVIDNDNAEKECCSNQSIDVDEMDVDFNVSPQVELTDLQLKFVSSFFNSFFSQTPPRVVQSAFLDFIAPLPSMDIYVLLERYLL